MNKKHYGHRNTLGDCNTLGVEANMNQEQAALKVFEEELGELAIVMLLLQQQVSKAIRFGVDEQRDLPTSNRERIESEWNDLLGSLQNLANKGIDLNPNLNLVAAKMQKIEKYTEYSESLGQVTPSKSLEPTEGVPKKHCQNGRADICLAGAVDGICCAENECDIDMKFRSFPPKT